MPGRPRRCRARLRRSGAARRRRRARPRDAYQPIGLVYGAGFEDRPALLARLCRGRTLCGNTPETVARTKDPHTFFATLDALGIPHPEISLIAPRDPQGWLAKRIGGSGGAHVVPAGHGGVRGGLLLPASRRGSRHRCLVPRRWHARVPDRLQRAMDGAWRNGLVPLRRRVAARRHRCERRRAPSRRARSPGAGVQARRSEQPRRPDRARSVPRHRAESAPRRNLVSTTAATRPGSSRTTCTPAPASFRRTFSRLRRLPQRLSCTPMMHCASRRARPGLRGSRIVRERARGSRATRRFAPSSPRPPRRAKRAGSSRHVSRRYDPRCGMTARGSPPSAMHL